MTESRFSGSFLVSLFLYVALSLVSLSGLLGSLNADFAFRAGSAVAAVIAIVSAAVVLWRNPASRPMSSRERRTVNAFVLCLLLPIVGADAYFEFFRPH